MLVLRAAGRGGGGRHRGGSIRLLALRRRPGPKGGRHRCGPSGTVDRRQPIPAGRHRRGHPGVPGPPETVVRCGCFTGNRPPEPRGGGRLDARLEGARGAVVTGSPGGVRPSGRPRRRGSCVDGGSAAGSSRRRSDDVGLGAALGRCHWREVGSMTGGRCCDLLACGRYRPGVRGDLDQRRRRDRGVHRDHGRGRCDLRAFRPPPASPF